MNSNNSLRHYEIVLLIHPDQSGQVQAMLDRYKEIITKGQGKIDRQEDWGRRVLAYPIKKILKAHYVMLNISCDLAILDELSHAFRYNDAILRHIVIKRPEPITTPSSMLKEVEHEKAPRKAAYTEEFVE